MKSFFSVAPALTPRLLHVAPGALDHNRKVETRLSIALILKTVAKDESNLITVKLMMFLIL